MVFTTLAFLPRTRTQQDLEVLLPKTAPRAASLRGSVELLLNYPPAAFGHPQPRPLRIHGIRARG